MRLLRRAERPYDRSRSVLIANEQIRRGQYDVAFLLIAEPRHRGWRADCHPGRIGRHQCVELCDRGDQIRWELAIQQSVTCDLLEEGHWIADSQAALKEHQRPLEPSLQ